MASCSLACACFRANSASLRRALVPNSLGRSIGTPTMSMPGHTPCRSGSPQGVFGGVQGFADVLEAAGFEGWLATGSDGSASSAMVPIHEIGLQDIGSFLSGVY